MTKTNQDNSFNFRFQNWERSTTEKTTSKHGENSSFPFFFFNKITKTEFSSRHRLRLQKFCMNSRYRTGSFWVQ
jgi:hypothetical protein